MEKENIYIDLSKCSEKERKHIFSLLPKEDYKVDMQIVKNYKHLHLCKIGWFVYIKPQLKTELTYHDFIKLFEGRNEENQIYTKEDIEKAYRAGENKQTYYFKDTTVILPTTYEGIDG